MGREALSSKSREIATAFNYERCDVSFALLSSGCFLSQQRDKISHRLVYEAAEVVALGPTTAPTREREMCALPLGFLATPKATN